MIGAAACGDGDSGGPGNSAGNGGSGGGSGTGGAGGSQADSGAGASGGSGGAGGSNGTGGASGGTGGSGGAGASGGAGGGTGGSGGASGGTGGATGGSGGASGGTGGSSGGTGGGGTGGSAGKPDGGVGGQGGASDGGGFDGGAMPPSGNPYEGARMYINPDYVAQVETSAASASPADAALFRKVEAYSTAIWLDSIEKSKSLAKYLDDALAQQNAAKEPVVTTIVVYDLPNRDCAANASNGELSVDNGGEARYKAEYIDPIAAVLRAHPNQRIAAIVEPDSLPNLATNLSIAKCAASDSAYRNSVAYAIKTLAMPNVAMYIDAAHAGWLGWDNNRTKIAQIYKDVLIAAGGVDKVRGFATNVANYNVLHGDDGTKLEPSNPCPDEITYVRRLAESLNAAGIVNKAFLIDTARNGRGGIRTKWGNWCNIRGAGIGERPRASPEAGIDAFYWAKPPGESDGTSDSSAPRYDSMCNSSDSSTGAPQAGQWFAPYFAELVRNASPPL
ncbi:MAG: glycoside hydrolase family 6 protein [Polyangiaceae bacterium]